MIFNGGQILNMAGLSSVCLDTDLLCVCVISVTWLMSSSWLAFLSLCSNHMRVKLRDDDGDVIAVHASQLLGQWQHLWQPLVVHCAKLVVSHRVAHQVGGGVLIFECWGRTSLSLLEQPLHLSQGHPVSSDFERLMLVDPSQILPDDTNHFLPVEGLPKAIRANHLPREESYNCIYNLPKEIIKRPKSQWDSCPWWMYLHLKPQL